MIGEVVDWLPSVEAAEGRFCMLSLLQNGLAGRHLGFDKSTAAFKIGLAELLEIKNGLQHKKPLRKRCYKQASKGECQRQQALIVASPGMDNILKFNKE